MERFDSLHPLHFTFFVQGTDAPSIFTNTFPGTGCNMDYSEFKAYENEANDLRRELDHMIAQLLAAGVG